MSNGYTMHGIDHVSASSLNLWAAQPALWVMERLLKLRAPVGPAAHVGTAVERGLEHALLRPETLHDAVPVALEAYDALSSDADQRLKIAPMVEQAVKLMADLGKPDVPEDGRQHRVEIALDGVPVPCIGFTDFVFGAHGVIVDLKTSSTLPTAIKVAHARQGAVYARAFSNYAMRFAYVTPKKGAMYQLDDVAGNLAALSNIARRLERFLAVSKDPAELAAIVCPDYESFYWSTPEARGAGRRAFGF